MRCFPFSLVVDGSLVVVSSRRGNVPDKKRKEKHAHLLRVSINTRIVERLIFFDHSARRILKKNLALETSNARD